MVEIESQSSTPLDHGKYNIQKWEAYLINASKRMQYENSVRIDYRNDFVQFMRAYADSYSEDLQSAYNFYVSAISREFIESSYELLDESALNRVLRNCKVMVITANPIEKAILHYCIMQKRENKKIIRIICGTNAYFIFKWGAYWVAHIQQPQTGSYKDLGLNTTVNEALKHFKPNVIFSLGVAFGIDYETQNIGDVIVSKKLFPYSENKRDEEIVKPDRSQDKTIDNWLDVRFINANGFLDGVTYGGILSGGSVMSSFDEKDRVCTAYSKNDYIVGGEMEGSALFQVSQSSDIPCAVIKGICDWGIAKNDIFPDEPLREECFKDSLQAFAMKKVVERCEPLFKDKTIFSTSKIEDVDAEKNKNKLLILSNVILNIFMLIIGLLLFMENAHTFIRYVRLLLICFSLINFTFLWILAARKDKYRITHNPDV